MNSDEDKDNRINQDRISFGRQKERIIIPIAPLVTDVPEGYAATFGSIKSRIQQERLKVVLTANSAMILLYWDIGRTILEKQASAGWGAKVIDRLSHDLREAFPDMRGFSSRNLKYMRAFAATWDNPEIVQQVVAQLSWRHNITLIERLGNQQSRLWYAEQAILNGWSQPVLRMHIDSRLQERQGKAITNFKDVMPPEESDMAAPLFKDPYLFDFLGTADLRREREIEQALVDHMQKFLIELGAGFAFVGRQVPLEVGDHDFIIDLLFYHLKLRCFVVIELKAVPFSPSFVGQLNVYLSAVDDLLRHPEDKPTIGLLLCQTKDKLVVEYALRDLQKPIGVAEWETTIMDHLPRELKGSLPTVEEIENELHEYIQEPKE